MAKSSLPLSFVKSKSPEYRVYCRAKQRCRSNDKNYGGRGIEFRFNSFDEFFAEIGRRPSSEHSIDRINNDGHYEPGNVRWATLSEQARNKRDRFKLTIDGVTRLGIEWAESTGIDLDVMRHRLKRGWCAPCALLNVPGAKCAHLPRFRKDDGRGLIFLNIKGEEIALTVAAERYGMSRVFLKHRLERGWCDECAVTIPSNGRQRKNTKTCSHQRQVKEKADYGK